MDSSEDTGPAPEAPAPRWFQRVLPTTLVGAAVVGLVALVVPAFQDQVALSVSHRPQSYVELYFARAAGSGPQVVCARRGGSVRVRFTVASHLDRPQAVAYRAAVDPSAGAASTRRASGSVPLTPGASHEVRRSFRVPRGDAYTVSVRLPALDQRLHAHCPGAGS